MDELWEVTDELDKLFKAVDPYIEIDKTGHSYIRDNAPDGTKELYSKAIELGKKETELMIKYGVQY